jgi:hypothetical protein
MIARRNFLKASLAGGISWLSMPLSGYGSLFPQNSPGYSLSLDSPAKLFDGKRCWAHPRAGIVPGAGRGGLPRIVMTMNLLDLSGSDVFRGVYGMETDDLGHTWSAPREIVPLAPRYEVIDGVERPVAVSDFWPRWHEPSGQLLGIGHTVAYTADWKVVPVRPRHTSYSVYDPLTGNWLDWEKMEMPDPLKFYNSGAGCVQRYDLPDGNILLPFSFRPPGKSTLVSVASCRFDGSRLHFLGNGDELEMEDGTRGLGEPSITRYNGEFFLTIRNDTRGYVARSRDGQKFSAIRPWEFDDGADLGNYNTQQHWVTHSEGLFLVYTRRGAGNDHVFRHRAPLFMARVNPETLQVIRSTETILVPERGARLGNFGITDVSPNETWVTVSEWMQPAGVEKYGSDGSIFVARIQWDKPNSLFVRS